MKQLAVVLERPGAAPDLKALPVREVLIAGYTGRNRQKVMEHIEELRHLGVAPPERIPTIFVVPPATVTTEPGVVVSGPQTSGEVEFYLVLHQGRVYLGVGSDHTDRAHEAISITESKAMCPKPVSTRVWDLEDVADHWDALELRAWITDGRGRRTYQSGKVDSMLAVADLLAALREAGYTDLEGRLIFGGTLPTAEGFVYGSRFEVELRDPVLDRAISHAYDMVEG